MIMLNKTMRSIAAAVALTVCAGAALASSTALVFDSFGSAAYGTSYGPSATFTDDFLFSIPTGYTGDVSSTVIAGARHNIWNANLTDFFFYSQGDPLMTPMVNSYSQQFFGTNNQYIEIVGLAAGSYGLRVAGQTLTLPGSYAGNVSLSVSAVPEPETYAMLLAGLGMLGFMVRRRAPSA